MKGDSYKYRGIGVTFVLSIFFIIFFILIFNTNLTLAQDIEIAGIGVSSAGGTLEARIYNYTTKTYESNITWSHLNLSQPQGWKIADQCLEITHATNQPSWGIRIYTDNKNNILPLVKSYTGALDPAGLIGQTNTKERLPLAWVAYANWNPGSITPAVSCDPLPQSPVEKPVGGGFSNGRWHWLKDINSPDNPDTPAVNEAFYQTPDGKDYVTVWNQLGVAVGDNERIANPAKIYIFLAADFSKATKQPYRTNSLTIEQFIDADITIFPFSIYKEGAPPAQVAYEWINSKMDRYLAGNQRRLIESYSDPYPSGPGHLAAYPNNIVGVAFTYDNALAICAYMARPTPENLYRAKLLCAGLIWAQQHDSFADGRWRDAYDATQEFTGTTPPLANSFFQACNTGNIAWTINALIQYYKNSNDTDTAFLNEVRNSAVLAGDFIQNRFYDATQAGYYYGLNSDGTTLNRAKSTEHNIAAYVAFSHLYDITGDPKWLQRANNAKSFVEDIAWHAGNKRYIVGQNADRSLNLNVFVADTNLLAMLAINNPGRRMDALNYVKMNFYKQVGRLEGIDFGYNNSETGPDGIWFEGTAQFASAYKLIGDINEYNKYLESIKLAQYYDFWRLPANAVIKPDYKSIVASSRTEQEGGLTSGLGWSYFASGHLATTAWFCCTKLNYNTLWGVALDSGVPSPGDNRKFTATPASLLDNNEYLKNHYYASGFMNYSSLAPDAVGTDPRCNDNPHSGDTCFKISWDGSAGADTYKWAGLIWQEPEEDWYGGIGKGYDLRGAYVLSFWARTDSFSYIPGSALQIKIYFGYDVTPSVPGSGDSSGQTPAIWISKPLTTTWQQYMIPVLGRDMSHISNGFTVIFNDLHTPRVDNKCNIYLDDIEFKKL